ncbi:MAG TPA: oligosaccharide flippase family protein [Mucilaginibacter sp.]|jgi:O-antigen/teichoic acid export membrane protein|nr:oligosaccharide flippase family protein [Mucilaginibacter sp.]
MKGKLFSNLSANFFQLIINQVTGLGIFYILSTGLDKNTFGQINLALAVLLAVFNVLSFGIDQILIKKIAAGARIPSVISLYVCHVLLAGVIFYGLLLSGYSLVHQGNPLYGLILLIGIGKLMIFFSTPFKQAASGMERFRLLAGMSVISNIIRCCGLVVLLVIHSINVHNIVFVFIAGDVIELILCIYLFSRSTKIPLKIKFSLTGYKQLLRESLPQTGVVLITSALARFDWIFIGFTVSAIKLAEYSFAYKIFEISTLPLLAIAPLLIPRFTKLFQSGTAGTDLKFLVRMEMVVSVFVALLLNVCWAPLIDAVTGGRYGLVNIKTIFILSLCMPFLYLNNFLWTIFFAQGKLKMILTSFVLTFFVNVVGVIVLIPLFKNEGAALAFLAACIAQAIYYMNKNEVPELSRVWLPLIICTIAGMISGMAAEAIFDNRLAIPASMLIYATLIFLSSQLRRGDQQSLKKLFHW